MRPEASIESYFIKKCKENQILQYKFISGETGVPDRIIICNGITAFVELKAKDGRLSARQKLVHKNIRNHGGIIYVPFSKSEVDDVIIDITNRAGMFDVI